MTIEQELLKVTKVRKQKDRQKFLASIVEEVNDLPEDSWDALSAEVQKWFNSAVKAHKADKDIPDFPDSEAEEPTEEEAEEAEEATTDDEEEAPKPKRAAKAKNGPTPKKKAAAKETSMKKKAKTPATGASAMLKLLILKKPDISKEDIGERLKSKGMKVSPLTISTQRAEFRHSLKVLQEAGMLKKKLAL